VFSTEATTLANLSLLWATLTAIKQQTSPSGRPETTTAPDRRGAVFVLFMHPSGTVKAQQKISATQGNFQGVLNDTDYFGSSVAALGDLDSDGIQVPLCHDAFASFLIH
jgi:hypothetical protein